MNLRFVYMQVISQQWNLGGTFRDLFEKVPFIKTAFNLDFWAVGGTFGTFGTFLNPTRAQAHARARTREHSKKVP